MSWRQPVTQAQTDAARRWLVQTVGTGAMTPGDIMRLGDAAGHASQAIAYAIVYAVEAGQVAYTATRQLVAA